MIEVTDEMVAEGATAWMEVGGGSLREHLTAAYRAMRALEAPPHDRMERRPFAAEEEEIIPEVAGHMDVGPPGSQWNWENLTRQQKTAVLSREKPSPFISPLEGAAGRMFNDPAMAEMDRRIDALTALVLELARRSPGYPPGDATLQRLIAELELMP